MITTMDARRNNFSPFTPSQWKELEEQAIIFNCISYGLPIPSNLLLSLRRRGCVQPNMGFIPPRSPMGCRCFQLGTRGKAEDSEPGRCRRTDGKKWRCSRVACPDSKYCERHLHRGRNRLRKQSEASFPDNSSTSAPYSHLSLRQSAINNKDIPCQEPGYFNGAEQDSSFEASSLNFQQGYVLKRPANPEMPVSFHRFFDERPERSEKDERSMGFQCSSLRRTDEISSSGSMIPEALPVLLDLNV